MFLGTFLFNKVALIILSSLVVASATVYGGIKTNEYRQVSSLINESRVLAASGKYQEAVVKLVETENKWTVQGTKEEIERLKEENTLLLQSSKDYELGKELFDKSKYNDALEVLKKVNSRNINYPSARSLIELAEKKSEIAKGEVAGISTKREVVRQNVPNISPSPSLPTSTPIPTQQSIPTIDPGKTAELRNIIREINRQLAIYVNAEGTSKFYQDQDNQAGTTIFQSDINTQNKIMQDAINRVRELRDRANILAAECPKCWEEAQK